MAKDGTHLLDAANEEGLVLEVQGESVHVVNAAHKEILVQRQVPEAIRRDGHHLLVLIHLKGFESKIQIKR